MKFLVCSLFIVFSVISSVSVQAAEILMVTWKGRYVSEKAFEKRILEHDPTIKITYLDANRDKKLLAERLRNYDYSNIDLIYSFGTAGTKLVQGITKGKKPIVFNVVSAPVMSGLVDSINKPGRNTTGARFLVDLETQLKFYMKVKPIKTLALWYDPREKHSAVVFNAIASHGKALGIKIHPYRIIPDSPKAQGLLEKAAFETNKMDAMYFVTSFSLASHAKRIMSLLDKELLILGSMNTDVMGGATVALGPDLSERGYAAANIAYKILKGNNAGEIPINIVDEQNAVLFVNKQKRDPAGLKHLDKLGVKIVELDQTGVPQ